MPRRARIRSRFSNDIRAAARRFRDHEAMSGNLIARWMAQFGDPDLDLAVRLLGNTRYYSGGQIRTMMRALVTQVYDRLQGVPRDRIYFIPVGRMGGGASILARALGETPGVERDQIKHMAEKLSRV